jgi:phenylpropionate dioxygenase-like ring-hydroxylating dioxygenase large terminal subunit
VTVEPQFTTDGASYPLNAWYAVCWDVDVGTGPFPRRVADRSIVLFRRADGSATALDDACWHRLAPLSQGQVAGGEIQCPYHGLRYDGDGRCTYMPAQDTINPAASVRAYPTVERHRFVWVWLGDPNLATPETIPDLHWNDDPAWAADGDVIFADCDYRLVLDNLMDLTHEEFLHTSSIGNEALSLADFEVTHTERTATVTRWMLGIDAPPLWRAQLAEKFPDYEGPVDRWQIINFVAPSIITLDVGVAIAGTGAPEGDRSQGISGRTMNLLTPVSRTASIYLWSFARDWCIDQQRLTTQLTRGVTNIFSEDEAMLVAQQRNIKENPSHEFYDLNIDAGGMWARRIIQRMIEVEKNS